MKLAKKLSPAVLEAAKPEADPYRIWDTVVPQLHLRVQPSGVKSFNVQVSRTTSRSLGKWPATTIEAARAQARALLSETAERGAPPKLERGTVADACRAYVAHLKEKGRLSAADTERRLERVVMHDRIASIQLAKLTQDDIEEWLVRIERGDLKLPKKKGRAPKPRKIGKASVNRNRALLVAAMNLAVKKRKVRPERAIEWDSVRPHEAAAKRRDLYLDTAQRRALLEAAGPDLRDFLTCIALTGCRPGDPAEVLRKDYDARHGTVRFKTKKHDRVVPLSAQAKALFDRLAKSKLPAAHLFTNAGRPWQHYDWAEQVRAAVARAELPTETVAYSLRHCWITDAISSGMDVLTVARLAGTSLQMIERHYGHLIHKAATEKLAEVNFL